MPQYTINGADRATGQERIVILEARDEADAQQQAQKMGLAVSRVGPFSNAAPPLLGTAAEPAPLGASYHDPESLARITTPLLVSGIANIVAGLLWANFGMGVIITFAMTTLGIYEFKLYGEAMRMPAAELNHKAKRMGISEIIIGVFNVVSFVCGVMVMTNAPKLRPAVKPIS